VIGGRFIAHDCIAGSSLLEWVFCGD
jgi:hypothetical protein